MKLAGAVAALFFLPTIAWAQMSDVTVQLHWLSPPVKIRILPQGASSQIRLCHSCVTRQFSAPISVKAAGDRLETNLSRAATQSVELTGAFRLEGAADEIEELSHRLEIRGQRGRLLLLLHLPLEDYVASVLTAEGGSISSEESLQALAIAIRTYAVRFRGRHHREGFDFCDSTHCQDLRVGWIAEHFRAAVEATEGELLWYQGEPAATYYHGNCGGTTEAAEFVWPNLKVPYLRQHADPYCATRGRGEWRSEIAKSGLRQALEAAGVRLPAAWHGLESAGRTPSGRAHRLRLLGPPDVLLSASALRFAVGRALGWEKIRSDLYEVRDAGHLIIFHGFGVGHGVGLCQLGTAQMGAAGKSHNEILSFYYPGTNVGVTARGLTWQALGSERVELLSTQPNEDRSLLPLAEKLLEQAERETGWSFRIRPQLKVYPSVAAFRNGTGEPGWIAASTRGRVIRLEPLAALRATSSFESTIHHELLHLLVESRAAPNLPLWFREGVVLAVATPNPSRHGVRASLSTAAVEHALREPQSRAELEQGYAATQRSVEQLIRANGKAQVLGWVERGLPKELVIGPRGASNSTGKRHQHQP